MKRSQTGQIVADDPAGRKCGKGLRHERIDLIQTTRPGDVKSRNIPNIKVMILLKEKDSMFLIFETFIC
jgi:hypothetical protein